MGTHSAAGLYCKLQAHCGSGLVTLSNGQAERSRPNAQISAANSAQSAPPTARPFRRLGKDPGARRSPFLGQQALNNGIHGRRTLALGVHAALHPRAQGRGIHINTVERDGGW